MVLLASMETFLDLSSHGSLKKTLAQGLVAHEGSEVEFSLSH